MIWTACKMFDMPQRSEPWHDIRKGKLTASQSGDWLAEEAVCRLTIAELREAASVYGVNVEKKLKRDELLAYLTPQLPAEALPLTITEKSSSAKQTAINKCLGAMAKLSGPPDYDIDPDGPPPRNPALWAIWNGIRLEDEAREALQRRIGEDIEEIGFCLHPKGAAGCSPDGLIKGKRIGVEIKCPISETHVGYLRNGKLPATYKAQVHFSMAITGAKAWHFWSYCPACHRSTCWLSVTPSRSPWCGGLISSRTTWQMQREQWKICGTANLERTRNLLANHETNGKPQRL